MADERTGGPDPSEPAHGYEAVPAITVHFHPDFPHGDRTVIEAIADDGAYLPQFVTGISNGGLTAHRGGDRWRWESRLFDGRYDEADGAARPVYGAWNRHGSPYGGSFRFGSAHLRLRPDVEDRATFCFPDSVREPTGVGRRDALPRLVRMADEAEADVLDDYVEAHVHGGVVIARDVEAIVLDPSHRGTPVEEAARGTGVAVELHPGFAADVEALDPDYRGEGAVDSARQIAREWLGEWPGEERSAGDGPTLTARELGCAARSGRFAPQEIKYVWHLLARFGRIDR
jgi:hypothetical protein